jgi:hypothetical protein
VTTSRERMLDLLPPPYAAAPESVVAQLLDAVALELEAAGEDVGRMRRAHWVGFVERLGDLDKLAALVGVERLPWEGLEVFRARLLALVAAHLAGALGPGDVRRFAVDYLRRAEEALDAVLVPGMAGRAGLGAAFAPDSHHPGFRPLALVENPPRRRRSNALLAIGGRVPYLYRFTEENRGLQETVATLTITGFGGGRSAVPVLANLTTGDLLGYRDVLRVGQRLEIGQVGDGTGRAAAATLDGEDASAKLFTMEGFELGTPFKPADLGPSPLLPRMARGPNDWVFLSAGLYGVRGLDHVFFAIADAQLREGVFDQTFFDHSLFPSGPVAGLAMEWTELEPASFELHVPRYLVIESSERGGHHDEIAAALRAAVGQLHAAGVRAELRLDPFLETQRQRARVRLPWVLLPPETGPAGSVGDLSVGARFGEATLATARFE